MKTSYLSGIEPWRSLLYFSYHHQPKLYTLVQLVFVVIKKWFFSLNWPRLLFFVSGFPQPEYRWMKDGLFLSEYSSEHFYKIQAVSKSDAGNYQCYAKNDVGTIVSESIPLTVACEFKFKPLKNCKFNPGLRELVWGLIFRWQKLRKHFL